MMKRRAIRILLILILSIAASSADSALTVIQAQSNATLSVRDAWMRQPTGERTEAGVFAIVENSSGTTRAIVGASADVAEKVELHEMKMDGAMMRMAQVKQIEVPARGRAELGPGGYHVMLFGVKKRLAPGDTFRLTLTFDDGSSVSATASVRRDEGMKMDDAGSRKK